MGMGLDILYFILLFQNLDFKLKKSNSLCLLPYNKKKQKKNIYI